MLPLYDNIRRRRIERGLSQQQLADMLGYKSRTTIAKIEAGVIDIPQSKIISFAKALGTTPGTLMGWTEPLNKALWRHTDIENDRIVRKFPGLCDTENTDDALQHELNSPLDLTITEDILSQTERKLLFIYRNYKEFQQTVDKLLIDFVNNSEDISPAPTRTMKIAAYGGGVIDHEITATDKEIMQAIEESEDDQFIIKKQDL